MGYFQTTTGVEMAAFLAKFFQESPDQQAEFQLGFAALRRTQLVELCKKAEVDVNPDLPATEMVGLMNGYLLQGKFDKLIGLSAPEIAEPVADSRDQEIADLKAEMAEMKRLLTTPAPSPEQPDPHAPGVVSPNSEFHEENKPALQEQLNKATTDIEELQATGSEDVASMSYKDLQKLAKEKGLKYVGVSGDNLRASLSG